MQREDFEAQIKETSGHQRQEYLNANSHKLSSYDQREIANVLAKDLEERLIWNLYFPDTLSFLAKAKLDVALRAPLTRFTFNIAARAVQAHMHISAVYNRENTSDLKDPKTAARIERDFKTAEHVSNALGSSAPQFVRIIGEVSKKLSIKNRQADHYLIAAGFIATARYNPNA